MGEIVGSIILEVAKCFVTPTERQFNYLRNYNTNVEKLKAQVEKLKDENASIQHKIDEAKRKGEEILDNVAKWVENVNKLLMDDAKKLIEDEETAAKGRCLKWLCPNLKARYQLSKKAVKILEAINAFLEEVGRFQTISYRTIPEDIRLISAKDYEAFESRLSILNDIISTLSNPDVNMIGIYGMGGVGKTTLAKKVARQVESSKLFDPVVFTEVSISPNIEKIQEEIADKLGLTLSEKSVSGKASQLYRRLKQEKKILIILDNIWERLDLEAVGIPHADDHKGCKILLTARSEDVLSRKMDSKQNFFVGVLKEAEAWSLFKKIAGDYIEGSEFKSVAKEVANECAGLAIAIVTVARALRNSKLFEWRDALQKLRMPPSDNFKDMQHKVYSTIKLSYEKLEGEELRKIFLLIAYTYITSIEDLLVYGMGLRLFQGVSKMEEARVRVQTLVHKLKASCMLLDGITKYEDFSMHDVVHDVGISIASLEHHVFTTRDELIDQWKWPDDDKLKLCTSIVLHNVTMSELPQVLEYPQLKFFYLKLNKKFIMPKDFFAGMTGLKVLLLYQERYLCIPPPSSIGLLTNLRVLCLYQCEVTDATFIGELKKLEILRIQNSLMQQFPTEIRGLTLLRVLELSHDGIIIPPNVISCLSHLEELYIGNQYIEWEVEVEGCNSTERRNASLNELKHLSNLTALKLTIKNVRALPRDLFFEKLERYEIQIGLGTRMGIENRLSPTSKSCRIVKIYNDSYRFCLKDEHIMKLKDGHIMKLKGMEELYLHGELEMDTIVYGLDKEGFPQLKHLYIGYNSKLQHIIGSSFESPRSVFPNLQSLYLTCLRDLEAVCSGHNQLTLESFSKLRFILLQSCDTLRNIFPFFIAQALSQLETIEISSCNNMEEIFDAGREDDCYNINNNQVIELSQLRSLSLRWLPKLTSFCSKKLGGISSQDNINVCSMLFSEKVALPKLEDLDLWSLKMKWIWHNQLTIFQNLTTLYVVHCHGLVNIVTSSTLKSLVRLKEMTISSCKMINEIIANDEDDATKDDIVFGELKFFRLHDLESLTCFCSGNHTIKFPILEEVRVTCCPRMKTFSEGELFTPKLHKVHKRYFKDYSYWKDDLNTTIQHLHKERELANENDFR